MTERKKFTVESLRRNKAEGKKTVWITAYDYPSAVMCEQNNIDMVLVGDSLNNCIAGEKSTVTATMDQMLYHTSIVAKGLKNTFLIGDMPWASYLTDRQAAKNASKFIVAGANAVKLEGLVSNQIYSIVQAGIIVFAHLGLTPQSTDSFGGYKVQGKTKAQIDKLIDSAHKVEECGASAILLEAVPQEATDEVLKTVKIPVLGIGAGHCDGQLLIWNDVMGYFFGDFKPKFAKAYCDLKNTIGNALTKYSNDVKDGLFPFPDNIYKSDIKKEPQYFKDWSSTGC